MHCTTNPFSRPLIPVQSVAFLSLFFVAVALAQAPTFDSVVTATLTAHRATTMAGVAVQLTGTVTYTGAAARSFTLRALRDQSRFELTTPDGPFIVVRQGRRIQTRRAGLLEPAVRIVVVETPLLLITASVLDADDAAVGAETARRFRPRR